MFILCTYSVISNSSNLLLFKFVIAVIGLILIKYLFPFSFEHDNVKLKNWDKIIFSFLGELE